MKTATLTLLLALPATASAESNWYAGSIVSQDQADNIIDARYKNGAQVTIEGIAAEQSSLEAGLRTPWSGNSRVSGAYRLNEDTWGSTIFMEQRFGDNEIRAAYLQNPELDGALTGGKLRTERITLDGNIGFVGSEIEARGFLAGIIGKLYASAGGSKINESLSSTQGWINPKKVGVWNVVNANIHGNNASGKLLIFDQMDMNRDGFDFNNQLYTGAEFENITTGFILAGWPPFDSQRTKRFSLAANWQSNEGRLSGTGEFGYNRNKMFTMTAGVGYDEDFSLRAGLLSNIPGTPLETWFNGTYNLRTGEMVLTNFYLGGSWDFGKKKED